MQLYNVVQIFGKEIRKMAVSKEERENFIKNTFKCISDCDNCGICTIYKVKDPINVYMDYIEGKKEYLELANEYR